MHIDFKQFIELVTEASGIESEKVEKQVSDLIKEINQAIEDGEAYSIDGFGIFSGIGDRILFIPSKELETEINFKYVGMEPIVLEGEPKKEEPKLDEDPFAGLQDLDEPKEATKRDPFAGLVDDFDEIMQEGDAKEDEEDETIAPGPKEWGIDAHKENKDGADKLLASLMGESYSEPDESDSLDEDFSDIFGEDSIDKQDKAEKETEEDEAFGLDEELSSIMTDDTIKVPSEELSAGIFDEDVDDVFSELEIEEDDSTDTNLLGEEETDALAGFEEEEHLELEVSDSDLTESLEEDILDDDFDDPFMTLEQELDEETNSDTEDVVPVITNISSGIPATLEKEPEAKAEKKEKKTKDPQPIASWVWIVLAVVVIAGITTGLAYFKVINIPGITPKSVPNIVAITPSQENVQVQEPVTNGEEVPESVTTPPPTQEEQPVQEQQTENEVPESTIIAEVPADQNKYGLNGVVNESANDGYTIVLFSLSVKESAMAKQKELTNEGYRAIVTPIESDKFGTLWRVSVGQFPSLADAADGATTLKGSYKENYFIKRIIN